MKKFVSLMLSLVMVLALVPSAFAAEAVNAADKFTDVSADAWYLDELNYAVNNGYISGTSDTTFSPDGILTRAQFVTILGRMMGVSTASGETRFTDVDAKSWYAPYVAWAAEKGYVNGTSATTFAPENKLTVEQMGTILANYLSKTGVELKGTSPVQFTDASSISGWAKSNMEVMQQYGLLVTDASGRVFPQKQVTRAEAAVSLVRLARGMGIGTEPVIQTKPVEEQKPVSVLTSFANQPVLAGKGITCADLIPGDPQLIATHVSNDAEAADNNIRYMLKNGLTQIELIDVERDNEWGSDASSRYLSNYMSALDRYADLGYESLLLRTDRAGMTTTNEGFIIVTDEAAFNAGVLNTTVTIGSHYGSDAPKYREAVLTKAIEVHDVMWASGAIKSTMTQKEKAKVYFNWIAKNCSYDWEQANAGIFEDVRPLSQTAYGALVDGLAVCEGYTTAYDLLLKLEGIDCAVVRSTIGSHEWSTATLDGTLYHIDATWGDTSGNANKYFCMTADAAWARFGGWEKELEIRQMIYGN